MRIGQKAFVAEKEKIRYLLILFSWSDIGVGGHLEESEVLLQNKIMSIFNLEDTQTTLPMSLRVLFCIASVSKAKKKKTNGVKVTPLLQHSEKETVSALLENWGALLQLTKAQGSQQNFPLGAYTVNRDTRQLSHSALCFHNIAQLRSTWVLKNNWIIFIFRSFHFVIFKL